MKKRLKENFNKLREKDTYTLLIFILYNLGEISDFKTLRDLIFILDKESLLKICQFFGDKEIKIPSTESLMRALTILEVYQKVNIQHLDRQSALQILSEDIKNDYLKLEAILNKYSF